jgi:hypothetical protein
MSPTEIDTGKIKLPIAENRIDASSSITNAVSGFCFAKATSVAGVYGSGSNGCHGVIGVSSGGGQAGYFEGNVTVTGDLILNGADCAENFATTDDYACEPGTVVVLDEGGGVRVSEIAYDSTVAGVIAGAGAYRPGIILDGRCSTQSATLAMIGKTYCKVDAAFGEIKVGDLLVTSPTRGHAMRSSDANKAFGAVIGKAMDKFVVGRGLIRILVCLQ